MLLTTLAKVWEGLETTVVTEQLLQDPELLATVLAMLKAPSPNVPTVTVNVFVTVAPAATVTSCV